MAQPPTPSRHRSLSDSSELHRFRRKPYRLLGADGKFFQGASPGTLGGNRRLGIYGRLDCASAVRALARGYGRHRVFFRDEAAAIAAGFRPCARCLPDRYREWKAHRSGPPSPAR